MCNENKVVLQCSPTLQSDVTAAWVLNTQLVHSTLLMPLLPMTPALSETPQLRFETLECYELQYSYCVYIIKGKQRLLIVSHYHSSSCK